jgi:Kef-type K+ transport system membrane component KefB
MVLDPIAPLLLYLAIIAVGSKLASHVMSRIRQPGVLGEILLGVLIGNLPLLGIHVLEPLKTDPAVDTLARLGVVILLFEIGLESTLPQMLKLGATAFSVAVAGLVASIVLGWGAAAIVLPHQPGRVHLLLGVAICATSVGISARVMQDLGRSQSLEGRLILAAALIDDVLGLMVVSVAVHIVSASTGAGASARNVAAIAAEAVAFLVSALVLGRYLSPRLFSLASRLRAPGVLLAVALSFCFALAWLANVIGLAPIVGAFAAGIILEEIHYRDLEKREERTLKQLVQPIVSFLAPIFFVLVGIRTDLRLLASPNVLGLAAALTLAAVLGKQACAAGVFGEGVNRKAVAAGMVPRGEVSLIVGNLARTLLSRESPHLGDTIFTAVVLMVLATTLVTPPALRRSLGVKATERSTD